LYVIAVGISVLLGKAHGMIQVSWKSLNRLLRSPGKEGVCKQIDNECTYKLSVKYCL